MKVGLVEMTFGWAHEGKGKNELLRTNWLLRMKNINRYKRNVKGALAEKYFIAADGVNDVSNYDVYVYCEVKQKKENEEKKNLNELTVVPPSVALRVTGAPHAKHYELSPKK